MGRDGVAAWVAAYERAWRSTGTEALTELFTTDATYQQGPFRLAALVGLVLRLPARFFAANLGCDLHGKLGADPDGNLGGHLSGSGSPRGSPGDRVLIVDIPAAA